MKSFVILLLSCVFISCKKDGPISTFKKEISGTWEIESRSDFGGLKTYPPGNGQIIVLTKDGGFQRKQHDTLIFSGKYMLDRRKDCVGSEYVFIFSTNESQDAGYQNIDLVQDKLTLGTSNCYADGTVLSYRKLQ